MRFCPSFKDLFKMIDEKEDASDVSVLTDAQHEVVVDECYQCKLCYVVCPYTPGNEQEWVVDFPRLMLRSLAIEEREGKVSNSAKLLARTDLQGKVATTLAPLVNRSNDIGFVRGLMEKTTGIAKDRLLPTFAKVRFSKWFRRHTTAQSGGSGTTRGEVTLFPDVSRRVPGSRDRQGDGRGVRAQRDQLPAPRRRGLLRDAVAGRGGRREDSRSTRGATSPCWPRTCGWAGMSSCRSRRARTC